MKILVVSAIVFGLVLGAAHAQDAGSAPQTPGNGQGPRGGRGGGWGMMGAGHGTMGTVTEVAADHYTIKTDTGETYTIHFSANTRIVKQQVGTRERGGEGAGMRNGGNPPQSIKPTDIKVGDAVAAMGEVDATAKSVGAVAVVQLDPERARQMREMQANYGKTWLMGKVTAVDGVNITIEGALDKTAHAVVADENTTFRKRREPITLADVQAGDLVRVEGSVKEGAFVATTIAVMGPPQSGTPMVPRANPPQ
jgi:hypothetical protein